MAYLDPKKAFADLQQNVVDGIRSHFPIVGSKQSIHLESLDVREGDKDMSDITGQHQAKINGQSWAVPVFGTLVMKNNDTGAVVDKKTIKLTDLPYMTQRYSYIVDGRECQFDNQWRLKPGAYTQRKENGELKTQFNVQGKNRFDVTLDPKTHVFSMSRGTSENIPVYPLMKELGVDDDTLQKSWGKDILAANRSARATGTALERFYKADKKRAPGSTEEARQYFIDTMAESKLRPDSTLITLGKPYANVNGAVLHDTTTKMIGVQRGDIPEDERDSLAFKDLRTVADFAKDSLSAWKTKAALKARTDRQINTATSIRQVVRGGMFDAPVKATFTANSLARDADQVNPVEMLSSSFQTTIMGPGGIQSENAISDSAKLVSPSHLGFLDGLATPEGGKTGITCRLPLGVTKEGNNPVISVFNLKTKKMDKIDPVAYHNSVVVLPDQVTWNKNTPTPVAKTVALSKKGNDLGTGKFEDADYVMRSPSQLFSYTTNLIPFMGNNSGNRVSYATHHIEQAISLHDRDAPLVQSGTGRQEGVRTFEDFIGRQSAHIAPIEGKVTSVTPDAITLTGKDGKEQRVSIYNNYPLNDAKAVLHSTPVVKEGDEVKSGQLLADNNFTRNGTLALGKNLRVGYVNYKGLNFEDGIVVSETAAQKMASEHMHKPSVTLGPDAITGLSKFKALHPTAYEKSQLAGLDDEGIVRVGQIVKPGDPLVVASRPFESHGSFSLSKIRKSLGSQTLDTSLAWKGDHPGEVVGVRRDSSGNVTVHVKTVEPLQVGSKLSARAGNKGVISCILPDKDMPHTVDGTPLEALLSPSGVPGRINPGQILETVASKIAEKTGKPYIVNNFEPGVDALDRVKKELATHGLSDTEELIDPISGHSLGHALTGKQHMLQLNFQIDKKVSARSGMPLEGAEPESYDAETLLPSQGGKTGGQSMGNLGMYGLLGHGAVHNIREFQTWKSEGPDRKEKWDSLHNEVWRAIQTGETPPPPKKTFAFQKFEDMLRAAGIDVVKKGHQIQVMPMTDKQVLSMSKGELPEPAYALYTKMDRHGEPVPRKGGVLDPVITGGLNGTNWSHIKLPEPVPNPIFEDAIQKVLGLKQGAYADIIEGKSAVKDGKIVPLGTEGAKAGGPGIAHLLERIDLKAELAQAQKDLDKYKIPENIAHRTGTEKIDALSKRVRYLSALDTAGIHPKDAYILNNLPVIPPIMRPVGVLPNGNILQADLNKLYVQAGGIASQMQGPNYKYLSDHDKQEDRAALYDSVKALMGVGENWEKRGTNPKGILLQIAGRAPKTGMFQDTLLSRRQDLSMRGTITPDAGLHLDYVGLPEKKALDLFRPFVVQKLQELGAASTPREAHTLLAEQGKKDPLVYKALDRVMAERPVLLKRDPVLHKHSVQAFWAQRAPGKAIRIHPLVTGGLGADFDGNCFVGRTRVALTIPEALWRDSPEALARPQESPMKFAGSTKILARTSQGYLVDAALKDIPYLAATRRVDRHGASVYSLPPGIEVWSYHHATAESIMAKATDITIEEGCDTARITMRRGLSVEASMNESLCVYDHETGEVRDLSPAQAIGRLSPVLRHIPHEGPYSNSFISAPSTLLKDNLDIVPITHRLLELLALSKEPCGADASFSSELATVKSVRKEAPYLSRASAVKALGYLKAANIEGIDAWGRLVLATDVHWDLIDSVVSLGKQRVYDLVVPETKVFAVNGGLVVWDTMAAFVPIGHDAVEEAKRMLPSNNITSESSGRVVYQPTLESNLGLFKLSRVTGDSKKVFDTHEDLLKAVQEGHLSVTDQATVGNKVTTAGRVLLSAAVPAPMQQDVLHNLGMTLDKKGVDKLYTKLAKDHKPDFADSASKLMRLGFNTSFGVIPMTHPALNGTDIAVGTHSFSLNDFTPDKGLRDPIVAEAKKKVDQIQARTDLSDAEKEHHVVTAWFDATEKMEKEHAAKNVKNPNNLALMQQAGVKPSAIQYRQLRLAPMLMVDSNNHVIPDPITKSYTEGLDLASYWRSMSGARRGSVLKVQEVREPGYFTKQLMNTTMGLQVTAHDCGTENGISIPVHSQDVFDRTLAQDHTIGGVTYKKDTIVTPQLASTIKAADKNASLFVRSTMKCDNGTGVCQKCAGLASNGQHYALGTNVGILSTQALGERATQLTLKQFHSGGLAERNSSLVNDFDRVQELTQLPRVIADQAQLASKSGVIEKIEEDPTGHVAWIGGVAHHLPNDARGNPLFKPLPGVEATRLPGGDTWSGIKVGMKVNAGDMLTDPSRTHVNPHDLYEVTGNMAKVQEHLATELHDIYGREGVRRQNTETVVRAISDLTRVIDPGDHETMVKGQYASRAKVQEANKQLVAQGLQPIQHTPIMKGIDVLPHEVQEDWMAQLNTEGLRKGIMRSAALGAVSDLHGVSPIPGMAYGAQFGLTSANRFTHTELKDVPTHAY
jgi:DNA-directed RNA polymerase subunit beta